MPLKTYKQPSKKHPQHFSKVYWPYLPLILIMGTGIWLGHPFVARSQRSVLAYSTNVTNAALLQNTNQQRLSNHDKALVSNPQLVAAAQAKANDMAKRNYWAHLTPEGATPWVFIDQAGFQYHKAGENLAYGFGNSDDVIKGWMNSPAHKANLLDKDFQAVGFGIANSPNYRGTGPETIVVAMYAQPGTPPAAQASHGTVAGLANTNNLAQEANVTISKAQTITGGHTPWITFVAGLLAGTGIAFLIIKNSVVVHRTWRKGERFAVKHPVFDVTIVALVALCALLCQGVGSIR